MWFIGVEVEQETSTPPPKKNPGSAPAQDHGIHVDFESFKLELWPPLRQKFMNF